MKLNRLLLPLGLVSSLLASCIYPYPPNSGDPYPAGSPDPVPTAPTVSSSGQESIREARDQVREGTAGTTGEAGTTGTSGAGGQDSGSSSPPPKKEYRVGIPIPGKEGFVFNPFTNNPVDVRAIPSGTLVRDPQDPNEDHLFRVP